MLNKEIIDCIGNPEYLKLLPKQELIKYVSVLLIELEDKFILMKNRWSHWEKGNLYISDINEDVVSLKELDYKTFTNSDIEFAFKDFNEIEYITNMRKLHKMLIANPFLIYKKCR